MDASSKDRDEGFLIVTGSVLQCTEFDNVFFNNVGALFDFFDLLLCCNFFVDISELFSDEFEEFSMIGGGEVGTRFDMLIYHDGPVIDSRSSAVGQDKGDPGVVVLEEIRLYSHVDAAILYESVDLGVGSSEEGG